MYIFSVDAPESLQFEPRQTFKRSKIAKRFLVKICLLGVNINKNMKNFYQQLAMSTNTHDY